MQGNYPGEVHQGLARLNLVGFQESLEEQVPGGDHVPFQAALLDAADLPAISDAVGKLRP